MKIKKMSYFESPFNVMENNGMFLFIAKEVATILEYTRTDKALSLLDDDEKLIHQIGVSGQKRKTWVINESGLYHLIIKSTKPEAKKFRKWVTQEVLPSIRKAGTYSTDKVSKKASELQEVKKKLDEKKEAIKSKKSEIKELEQETDELEKKFWQLFHTEPDQLSLFENNEEDSTENTDN